MLTIRGVLIKVAGSTVFLIITQLTIILEIAYLTLFQTRSISTFEGTCVKIEKKLWDNL
mgnify:CR=1 FL=1